MRSITVAGRAPLRNACMAATIAAGSLPESRGTGVSMPACAGWQPEHDMAPAGASAADAGNAHIPAHKRTPTIALAGPAPRRECKAAPPSSSSPAERGRGTARAKRAVEGAFLRAWTREARRLHKGQALVL